VNFACSSGSAYEIPRGEGERKMVGIYGRAAKARSWRPKGDRRECSNGDDEESLISRGLTADANGAW
jgi:hypothetical protein